MRRQPLQTYEEYCATMKAYRFHALDRETWQSWQDYYQQRRDEVDNAVGGCEA